MLLPRLECNHSRSEKFRLKAQIPTLCSPPLTPGQQEERVVIYRKNVFAWEQSPALLPAPPIIGGGLYFVPGWPGILIAVKPLHRR